MFCDFSTPLGKRLILGLSMPLPRALRTNCLLSVSTDKWPQAGLSGQFQKSSSVKYLKRLERYFNAPVLPHFGVRAGSGWIPTVHNPQDHMIFNRFVIQESGKEVCVVIANKADKVGKFSMNVFKLWVHSHRCHFVILDTDGSLLIMI